MKMEWNVSTMGTGSFNINELNEQFSQVPELPEPCESITRTMARFLTEVCRIRKHDRFSIMVNFSYKQEDPYNLDAKIEINSLPKSKLGDEIWQERTKDLPT